MLSEFPNFRTIGERGTTEIHAMTNARGLPILLPNDIILSKFTIYLRIALYNTQQYNQVLIKIRGSKDFN